MQFSNAHVQTFRSLSKDNNPLHHDLAFARNTPFGRPVVYGVCAVFAALSEWSKGKPFSLSYIAAKFHRPLFVGTDYEVQITENERNVRVSFYKGPIAQATVSFSLKPVQVPPLSTHENDAHKKENKPTYHRDTFTYSPQMDCLSGFLKAFHLNENQIPSYQMSALLWASYFVGTEHPGTQALFSNLEIYFDPEHKGKETLEFWDVTATKDPRFQWDLIEGHGSGISRFALQAFERQSPVRYTLSEIAKIIPPNETFRGRSVFISGCGRGLGSVLARGFALSSAKIAVNFLRDSEDSASLLQDLKSSGAEFCVLRGDCSDLKTTLHFKSLIQDAFGSLHYLVHNAFTGLSPAYFMEQTAEEFLTYVTRNLSIVSTLTHSLLPLVPSGGSIIGLSTVMTASPDARYSHYITAKAAVEALLKSLALEHRQIHFRKFTLNRFHTDQTSGVGQIDVSSSAIDVAKSLLDALSSPMQGAQHATL